MIASMRGEGKGFGGTGKNLGYVLYSFAVLKLYELSQEHFRHHQRIASVWACIAQSAAAQQAKLPQKNDKCAC